MEFLIGRTLSNNIMNLGVEPLVRTSPEVTKAQDWPQLLEEEPDAGLGNGGLGPAGGCFIDSLATLQFRPWVMACATSTGSFAGDRATAIRSSTGQLAASSRSLGSRAARQEVVQVPLDASFGCEGGDAPRHPRPAIDRCSVSPTIGRSSATAARRSTRCASGRAPRPTPSTSPSSPTAISSAPSSRSVAAESLTRVLYPDDSTAAGRALRFLQQYFMVSCSLQDIIAASARGEQRLVGAARPGRRSSSTTRTRRWPSRS